MTNFLHDAEFNTESWRRRHSPEAIKQLGVWRWKGIQDNAVMILSEIVGKRVIDFGGADGPLGFGSEILDQKNEGNNPVYAYQTVDVIFSSHTLEHIGSIEKLLSTFKDWLKSGGCLIVHVPSYTCVRWRAENYSNPNQSENHHHTFSLHISPIFLDHPVEVIDITLKKLGFNIEFAEYVGDDSILILGRKK